MKTNRLLEGAYDIHVHAAPDVVPRAMDLRQLCREAEQAGMAGILLKDHCTSTVGRAAALNLMGSGACRFYSALALNPPQSGILGMHKIESRPIAVDGKVEVRPMMYVALSYDHRLVDGREAVTFLVRIKECIEDPQRLLLDI